VNTQPEQLRDRTKKFALRVIRLFRSLPYKPDAQVLGKQLLRCGTSVVANYRAVCRARSKTESIAKVGIVVEEVDESVLWLELLTESGIVPGKKTSELLQEARELTAILPPRNGQPAARFSFLNYTITRFHNYSMLK
jgi:four helix bundle protein